MSPVVSQVLKTLIRLLNPKVISGSFFFRISKNGGNSSGASFDDRTKRFFGSDSKIVGPTPHVSLFSDFDPCPEIFSDMQILKLHYLRIQNLKIKQKFSRTVLIY